MLPNVNKKLAKSEYAFQAISFSLSLQYNSTITLALKHQREFPLSFNANELLFSYISIQTHRAARETRISQMGIPTQKGYYLANFSQLQKMKKFDGAQLVSASVPRGHVIRLKQSIYIAYFPIDSIICCKLKRNLTVFAHC